MKKLCAVIEHLQIAKFQINSSQCKNFDELRMQDFRHFGTRHGLGESECRVEGFSCRFSQVCSYM